jgi:serine/threonine protein kinase
MELAPGGDLCSFVYANGGRLNDLATRVIIRQITIAVQYLHYNGIVHRDIKPENILMMNTAVGHRVALADFGCAVNINLVKRMETLVGTADYVAPYVSPLKL